MSASLFLFCFRTLHIFPYCLGNCTRCLYTFSQTVLDILQTPNCFCFIEISQIVQDFMQFFLALSIEISCKYSKKEVFNFYNILVPVQDSQTKFYTFYWTYFFRVKLSLYIIPIFVSISCLSTSISLYLFVKRD